MAGPRRRRGPLPQPPPLGAIVIDGSNVIASSTARPLERLERVLDWCRGWRPDLPVHVFVDHRTVGRLVPEAQARLAAWCEDVTPGRARCTICPRGAAADGFVLAFARAHDALVVSNDRYFDHEDLRRNAVTVQFTLAGDRLELFPEATWFRSPGTALRVALADLQQRRAPAAP
ncbi:MAG: hypothetical protein KF830_07780 [Planctomycetes bacterium]|nr:hypothetical protein [Planctomycetota bacterium]